MLNRWIGILAFAGMLLANAAIFVQDVLPRWLPDDAPPTEAEILSRNEARYMQYGLFGEGGRRLGQSWTFSRRYADDRVTVTTTTLLEPLHVSGVLATPRVRLESLLTYRGSEGRVDEIDFRVHGLGFPVLFRGESYADREFACKWQVGERENSFLLDARMPAVLGDVIRPFHRLPKLYVGRRWRVKLLDPLTEIFPQLGQSGLDLEPVVLTVTRTEPFEYQGRVYEAFVVEGGEATAWVAPDGRVLCQVATLPLLGELRLLLEDSSVCYDAQDAECGAAMRSARQAAVDAVPVLSR